MQLSDKTTLFLSIAICASLGISACQPKSELPQEDTTISSTESSPIQNDTSEQDLSLEPSDTAQETTSAEPTSQTCLDTNISTTMQYVDDSSQIEDIEAINSKLETCLPHTDSATVLNLLRQYDAMYTRFLAIDYEQMDTNLDEILYLVWQKQFIPPQQLDALPPRVQYLVNLAKSDPNITVRNEGEGFFSFSHNLKAMADLFTPYLAQDQQVFIDRMAQDNQQPLWGDAAITIPYRELMERALFWEEYVKRYPQGFSVDGAKHLFHTYRYLLFYGSENSLWTDDDIHEFYDPRFANVMQQLSEHPTSQLAQDAQKFLAFMALPDDERLRQYPVPVADEEGYKIQDYEVARYQLAQALPIPPYWEANDGINCLEGILCDDFSSDDGYTQLQNLDSDAYSEDTSPSLASLCPAKSIAPLQITQEKSVWGFNPLFSDDERKCYPLYLQVFAGMDCEYNNDLMQKSGLILYEDNGNWYKFIYANAESCQFALEIYNSHSEEV